MENVDNVYRWHAASCSCKFTVNFQKFLTVHSGKTGSCKKNLLLSYIWTISCLGVERENIKDT